MINFLMSLNNTNSLSNSNVIRKSSDKRISIDWTPYSLRYCHNTCVRTVKRVDFNILEVKGLIPLKSPMVLLLPKLKKSSTEVVFFLFRFDWNEARITIHVLNISVPQQLCYLHFWWLCNTVFIISLLFVCFSFLTLNT